MKRRIPLARIAISCWRIAMKVAAILLGTLAGAMSCVSFTEVEREELAYDLNEARSIYEQRRQACLDAGAHMVVHTLTGSRRLSISEMEWAYCSW